MSASWAIFRKVMVESRWLLGISAVALFGLAWLFLFLTSRFEAQRRLPVEDLRTGMRRAGFARMARAIGGPSVSDDDSGSLALAYWKHPFFLLLLSLWPISRGSAAVAGEVERGTLDLVLSRPVSRVAYLGSQVAAALAGMLLLGIAMASGVLAAARVYPLEAPPRIVAFAGPILNVTALGMVIFAATLLVSSVDVVRWRATLIGSTLTLASFILLVLAQVFAGFPSLEHLKWVDQLSIFRAFDPVEALVAARNLPFNAGLLGAIAAGFLALATLAFTRRDLPANG